MSRSWFRRNFCEPLLLLKSRSPRRAYWKKLERTQYFSRQQLEDIQWRRLQVLWDYMWQHNTFYRKRFQENGLRQEDLKSIEDIRRVPILTKKDIRQYGKAMISNGFNKEELLHFQTGGSTGKALDIYITEECSELRNACARRHDRWTGWEPGEPVGAVWGNPKLPANLRERIIDACVQPYIYLDTMAVSEESVLAFSRDWQRIKPTLLFGHAHSIYLLAQQVERLHIESIAPKGIISTSMMLLPHERELIEKVFHCSVTDRYGCEEVSLIGCECEKHQGMHMNIEHLVIEFLKEDGSEAAPGEPGQIVVTDLMNKAMPFIRYRVEDVGIPLDSTCSCGRGLPLMDKVVGRVADFLIKQDGTKVAGISLIENTLTKLPALDQMQIVQESINDICLNIVPGEGYTDDTGQRLVSYFRETFGNEVQVRLRLVKEIAPETSGKYRFSVCKIEECQ